MFLEPNTLNRKGPAGTEHIDNLYSYAMILIHNPTAAEDLVKETYVRAIPAIGRLRAGTNVKIWLFTISRNIWSNQFQGRSTRPPLLEVDRDGRTANLIAATSQYPRALDATRAHREQIREAIQKLPWSFAK